MSERYEEGAAPFNFAIATLMRIDRLLRDIKVVSVMFDGNSQRIKYKLCRQILVNACALIKNKEVEKQLINNLAAIELKVNNNIDPAGRQQGVIQAYDEEVDRKLDLFLIEVSNKLQGQGNYFMPEGRDEGL